ncbi:GGDEF domain-containing protein [Marinomonas sp. 5E14-1]|uniref:GGDEF domain-containing protein n=1 Tax=Marinomonas sp. 5E14-1 TaxID=3153922 RepID=UPI0032679584
MRSIQTDIQFVKTKAALHRRLSLINGLIVLAFGIINLYLQQFDIAFLEAVLGILNIYFFWSAKRTGTVNARRINFLLFSISAVMFYTFSTVDLRTGISYWLLILPPLYCIFLGPKKGLIYSILVLIPTLYLIITKSDTEQLFAYRSALNFTGAYFLAYSVCFLYENQYIKNSQILHHMAYKDPLTEVKNRHALEIFFEEFNSAKDSNAQTTQLLILDVDYFKKINDQFGHEVGDLILVEFSSFLRKHVGKDNAYRIGGEEFLVTLQNSSPLDACNSAENLRKSIEKHEFKVAQNTITLTVSIGISELKKGMEFNAFLRNADQNLYLAKNQGRNIVRHDGGLCSEIS